LPGDGKCVLFYNLSPKIWGPSPRFFTRARNGKGKKRPKIRRDFGQPQMVIANISATDSDIDKRKTALSTTIFPTFEFDE